MSNRKYTREHLAPIVAAVESVSGVLRALGFKTYSGSTAVLIRARIKEYGLDVSHFCGYRSARGIPRPNRRRVATILVVRTPEKGREKTVLLRRALLEAGVPHECAMCAQGPIWHGRKLTLSIDHVSGEWWDNRKTNLRFICPNCHSQTGTFGKRSRK